MACVRRRQWQATPVLLPRKSHGWRSLVGCSPWGRYASDATERLHFHFSLSHNGEGNGNPLQCSCLEIPGTGEPGGLPSMGSHRIGHDWSDLAAAAAWLVFLGLIKWIFWWEFFNAAELISPLISCLRTTSLSWSLVYFKDSQESTVKTMLTPFPYPMRDDQ